MALQRFYKEGPGVSPDETLNKQRAFKLDTIIKRLCGKEKTCILHEAATTLAINDRDFENRLDANKALLGFVGGVYDLDSQQYRQVRSTDMLTVNTGYKLPEHVDLGLRDQIMDFIRSIMPDEEAVTYLLKYLASCLDGYNREETFTIATGVRSLRGDPD